MSITETPEPTQPADDIREIVSLDDDDARPAVDAVPASVLIDAFDAWWTSLQWIGACLDRHDKARASRDSEGAMMARAAANEAIREGIGDAIRLRDEWLVTT